MMLSLPSPPPRPEKIFQTLLLHTRCCSIHSSLVELATFLLLLLLDLSIFIIHTAHRCLISFVFLEREEAARRMEKD